MIRGEERESGLDCGFPGGGKRVRFDDSAVLRTPAALPLPYPTAYAWLGEEAKNISKIKYLLVSAKRR